MQDAVMPIMWKAVILLQRVLETMIGKLSAGKLTKFPILQ